LKDNYLRLRLLLVDRLWRLDDRRRVLPRSNVLPAADTAWTASGLALKFAHLAPVSNNPPRDKGCGNRYGQYRP
jgi:hypothetical protein